MRTTLNSENNSIIKVNKVLEEVINKCERNELHPVLGDEIYNIVIEYLTPEFLEVKEDYRPGSPGLRYELVKEITNKREIINNILVEYENLFKHY